MAAKASGLQELIDFLDKEWVVKRGRETDVSDVARTLVHLHPAGGAV